MKLYYLKSRNQYFIIKFYKTSIFVYLIFGKILMIGLASLSSFKTFKIATGRPLLGVD